MKLLQACNAFPAAHDGITILKPSGKPAWRLVRSPGTKCLVERQSLIDILSKGILGETTRAETTMGRQGVETRRGSRGVAVEYDKAVKTIKKTIRGWELTCWDGEMIQCDLLIGVSLFF